MLKQSSLKHITSIRRLSRAQILKLLDRAIALMLGMLDRQRMNVFERDSRIPPGYMSLMLQRSTGTRTSFETAAFWIGCSRPTGSIDDINRTSVSKGESLHEFVRRLYLQAGINFFGIRSEIEGLSLALALEFDRHHPPHTLIGPEFSFFNAGEGSRYHPTQVLLDLLCMVVWGLFRQSIDANPKGATGRSEFAAALRKFIEQKADTRTAQIASVLDGKTICFAGDLESRILYDFLALAEADAESGYPKFDLHFLLVAPEFARIARTYLARIPGRASVIDDFNPDLPADYFYRLRFRREDRDPRFEAVIDECERSYRITRAFVERLRTREKPGFVLDALPIDKVAPAIEVDAWDHPNVICWLQAFCSCPLRAACLAEAHGCWRDDVSAIHSRWQLIDPLPAPLSFSQERSLKEHHERVSAQKRSRRLVQVKVGSALDHLPVGMAEVIRRVLGGLGFKGQILSSDKTPVEGRPGYLKDILWFPDVFLHEWDPQILTIINLITGGQVTYNTFNQDADELKKFECGTTSHVVGVLRCPRPQCVDAHRLEVPVTPMFEVFHEDKATHARCCYCGSIHAPGVMLETLRRSLGIHQQ